MNQGIGELNKEIDELKAKISDQQNYIENGLKKHDERLIQAIRSSQQAAAAKVQLPETCKIRDIRRKKPSSMT